MRRQSRKGGGRQVDVTIEALGAQGDGIAFYGNRPVFVPLTLPGERVRLRLQAQKGGTFRAGPLELLQEGKGRAEAPCPHFGSCGACQLQHLDPDYYRSWKEALIPDALQRQGIEAERLHAPIYIAPGTRRRAALAFRQQGRRLELGFHKSTSRSIVDLKVCLLLTPALFALLQPLRRALEAAGSFRGRGDVLLLQADNGVDLLLITPDPPELAAREHLIRFATEQDIARITWASDQRMAPELLFQQEAPRLAFGGVPVTPPPGGFVQPSREGEEALVSAVRRAIPGGTRRIIELFAGCGSFTFPLAEGAFVTAVEGDAAALEALWSAARRSGLAGPVMIEQ